MAGCGLGTDAPADPAARAELRRQALAWLRTNLSLLTRRLASGTSSELMSVADQMSACLAEKELAGVRPGAPRDG